MGLVQNMSFDLLASWLPPASEVLVMPTTVDTVEATDSPAAGAKIAAAPPSAAVAQPLDGWEIGQTIPGRRHIVYRCRPAGSLAAAPFAYALKLFQPECRNAPISRQLLAREAMAGQLVRSPHVVPVLSARIAGEQPYLVLPWLAGRTLQQRFDLGQSFSTAEAVWIVRQAACGLGALAERGFIHNDVKPSNLMVSDDGHVTVLDLGFATRLDQTPRTAVNEPPLLGTPAYQPPERTAPTGDTPACDVRSDIFSLGLILAELLLSGNPSNDDRNGLGSLRADELVRRLRATVGLPRGLFALVSQMLARHPWRRPDNYPELIRRLTALEIAAFACRGW